MPIACFDTTQILCYSHTLNAAACQSASMGNIGSLDAIENLHMCVFMIVHKHCEQPAENSQNCLSHSCVRACMTTSLEMRQHVHA